MKFFSSRKGLQESEARSYVYTHTQKHTACMRMCAHTTVKQSLTVQIERFVQAFFNMALTPDISFVSVIKCSGFAASRSCQTPYSQTLCITAFCNCCRSFFCRAHQHLTLCPQQDLNKRTKRKGSSRQGNGSNRETEQIPQRTYLHREFSASSNPQIIIGNILLASAWKELISLVSGLCTVQNF